jgi:phage major head subunit gpT-like protein
MIKTATLKGIETSFKSLFAGRYSDTKNYWSDIAMRVSSSNKMETYAWLAALPIVKKIVGEYAIAQVQMQGYTLINDKFGGIIEVPAEDIEDDRIGTYAALVKSWASRAAQAPDNELTKLLIDGFNATKGKDYTGLSFFNTAKKAHPKAVAYSNRDNKKFSAANFESALAGMIDRVDASGQPMYLGNPENMILVVCAADRAAAKAAVELPTLAAGGDNPNYKAARVLVWSGLESAAASLGAGARPWFLFDVGQEIKPFIFQEREAFGVHSQTSADSDTVFTTDNYRYKVKGRFAVGYGLPEFAFGSTGEVAA